MKTFSECKNEYNSTYQSIAEIDCFLPIHLSYGLKKQIKNKSGHPNEEFYKWQFFYSLIHSGMYGKDYMGAEIQFPKGNISSAPIRFDGAIFDDKDWIDHYTKFHASKDQSSLDWLRKHLIAVIEFKKENGKNTEAVWNQQLKPALKESENDFCLGILYDTERLFLFKKQGNYFLRLDDGYNLKKEQSSTKDLSIHLADGYYKIPSFEQLKQRIYNPPIDRSKRTINELEIITGAYSSQLSDGISNILKTMDKVSLKNQRGYEILIQILALKIFDEKRSQKNYAYLEFYKSDEEKAKSDLLFFVTPEERNYINLSDDKVISFVERMRALYNEASQEYHFILNRVDTQTITWEKEEHVRTIAEIVEQFQDYSFVKSHKTDLYQIVFYKFASEFSKADKGQFVTPIPLIDFLVRIVNPRNDERVIDPTAGIADFLSVAYVNSHSKLDDKNIYGLDNDEQMIMLAQLNMLLNGDGNSILKYKPDKGSIVWKFDDRDNLVELNPKLHKNGNWDNWRDGTKLKKFDVVLTNPPFGKGRKYIPASQHDRDIIEMYELWDVARGGNGIDLGLVFLENAYRILKDNGRMGIVISNSIASIDEFEKAREWLLSKMRIVACFDMPANVFAETGVITTIIVAYKPKPKELERLIKQNYQIFMKDITNVGYKVSTDDRVKRFDPIYKRNIETFDIEIDEEGQPILDEDFNDTVRDFKAWCLSQEETLKDLFIKEK
ncbi:MULTISPECIES: HsdM family class I SAM-dependent methyltransferase [Parabacteroides]|uniref:HsdM family class I SAM-dependent methyltransferase n=1 Tax=Parabacteroides provencensis TaxID=1944636 RepID=UPI0018EC5192|nr:N-6 DNA methylase [Parabacteroides provencensis]